MAQIDELLIRIKGDISELESALEDADGEMSSFGDKMTAIGGAVGKGLLVAGTAAAALGAASVVAASDFETSMVAVRQDVNGTADEMADLERSIRDMGASGPVAASDLAGVAARLGEVAGIGAAQMPFATDAVVKFSQATGTDLAQATEVMAQFVRTTGLAPEELDNLGSAAVALSSQFKAPEADLLAFAERLGPVGKELGVTQDALLAFGATFVGAGVDAGRGANAVKDILLDMDAAVSASVDGAAAFAQAQQAIATATLGVSAAQAKVTEAEKALAAARKTKNEAAIEAAEVSLKAAKAEESAQEVALKTANKAADTAINAQQRLEAFAAAAGMSAEEFKVAFQQDATSALAEFLSGLQQTQQAGGDVTALLKGIGIEGGASADALLRVAGSTNAVADALAVSESAWSDNKALAENAAIATETFGAKMATLKNQVIEVGITIGQAILPAVEKLVGGLAPLLTSLAPVVQDLAGIIAGALADLLPILQPVLEALVGLIKELIPPLKQVLGPVMEIAKTIASNLTPVIQALTPILAALWKVQADLLAPILEAVNQLLAGLLPVLADILVAVAPLIQVVLDLVLTALQPLLDLLGPLIEALMPVIVTIGEIVAIVAEGLTPVLRVLQPILEVVGAIVKAVLTPVIRAFGTVLQFIVGIIRDELAVEFQFLGKAAEVVMAAWEPLRRFFEDLWTGIQLAFTVAAAAIGGAWDGLVGGIKAAINLVISGINWLIGGLNSLIDGINTIAENAADLGGLIDVVDVPNIPHVPTIPHLDVGGQVLRDGLAVLHEGEIVVPAAQVNSPFAPGMGGGGGNTFVFGPGSVVVPVQELGPDFDADRTGSALMEAMQRAARSVAAA
ncbi:MAG: phage tail tape measure protein [Halobacteriales archaeon]|nr:phage tail tape measure protein [Halobacteriales archaeon]